MTMKAIVAPFAISGHAGEFAAYQWDFSAVWQALPALGDGVRITIILSIIVMALSLLLAVPLALARLSSWKALSWPAYAFTEFFRSTPMLVQIVWFFWVLPVTFGIGVDTFATGVIALTFNMSAFLSEIYRGGILSIDPGQREAALATGLTEWAAMRRIVLPQALRRSIPLIAGLWISLFKDTSLVAFIGVRDLMFEARKLAVDTYRPMEVLTVAAIIYFLMTYPQSVLINRLFERFRVVE